METIREKAIKGEVTDVMNVVANEENHSPEYIREGIADGTIVIPYNKNN